MYCTGIDKAMLAAFREEEWPERITKERKPYTPQTVTDYDEIMVDMQICMERGYVIGHGGRELGLRCVGVPVREYKR